MANVQNFQEVFDGLRRILKAYEPSLFVQKDEPGAYYLALHRLRDDGYRPWFGGVEIKKRYVSFHLMPVYGDPDLLTGAPPALRRRMQGKSCFNFTRLDEGLTAGLEALTARAFGRYQEEGLIGQ